MEFIGGCDLEENFATYRVGLSVNRSKNTLRCAFQS